MLSKQLLSKVLPKSGLSGKELIFDLRVINRGYLFFSVKDRNLFHRVDTISNIFTSGTATSEIITDGVHEMK